MLQENVSTLDHFDIISTLSRDAMATGRGQPGGEFGAGCLSFFLTSIRSLRQPGRQVGGELLQADQLFVVLFRNLDPQLVIDPDQEIEIIEGIDIQF